MFNFSESDIITTDSFLEIASINPEKLCYVKTDYLKNGGAQFIWRNQLHPVELRKIAIIGHSDHSVDDEDAEQFDLIFCVNKNTKNKKVYGLPLGLPNACDDLPSLKVFGDKKMVVDVSQEKYERTILAYLNFNQHTFPLERCKIFEMFRNHSWVKNSKPDDSYNGRLNYLKDLKKSKFCFCPRGNGIDTHRMWESLYMGCIPIVINHQAHDFCHDLPILFIEDWEQIDLGFLNKKWIEMSSRSWNYEKLKVSYWRDYIIQKSID